MINMHEIDFFEDQIHFDELASQIEDDRLNGIPLNEVLEFYKHNLGENQIKNIYLGI